MSSTTVLQQMQESISFSNEVRTFIISAVGSGVPSMSKQLRIEAGFSTGPVGLQKLKKNKRGVWPNGGNTSWESKR